MSDDQYSFPVEEGGSAKFNLPNVSSKSQGDPPDEDQNSAEQAPSSDPFFEQEEGQPETALKIAQRHLMDTVRRDGYEADSLEEAWGKIISVQTEIALDPAMGSKATTAAKFLAQALGISSADRDASEDPLLKMDNEAAQQLLSLITAERKRRAASNVEVEADSEEK